MQSAGAVTFSPSEPGIPVAIPFRAIEEHKVRMAERYAQLMEAEALIDKLDSPSELSRIWIPNPGEVHLTGWFTPAQLRALANYMKKRE